MYSTEGNDDGKRGASAPRIAILAFGRRGYLYGSANLALSIKSHGAAHVRLLVDQTLLKYLPDFHRALFDEVEVLPEAHYMTGNLLDPGKCKAHIGEILGDGEWLYVDADTLCLGSIQKLWDGLRSDGRDFICEVIDDYTPWATPEKIRAKVGSDGASIYGVQTSWMFVRGGSAVVGAVRDMHDAGTWRRTELDHQWGRSMPDELLYSTACAKLGLNPTGPRVTFYGKDAGHTLRDIQEQFLFLSLYGNGRGRTLVRKEYIQWYDPIMAEGYARAGGVHMFKVDHVQRDKYLG